MDKTTILKNINLFLEKIKENEWRDDSIIDSSLVKILWTQVLSESLNLIQRRLKKKWSVKDAANRICDFNDNYKIDENLVYPKLWKFEKILKIIEEDNNTSLSEYMEAFSPIFNFIVKNSNDFIIKNSQLKWFKLIDDFKFNPLEWWRWEPAKTVVSPLLWFLTLTSLKNIWRTPEEVSELMFDHMLLPFYSGSIIDFNQMKEVLVERSLICKSIIELDPWYFNKNLDVLNYIIKVESNLSKILWVAFKEFSAKPEFIKCKIPQSIELVASQEWMIEKWIRNSIYENISKSTTMPSIQKVKTLKAIWIKKPKLS